MQHNIIERVNVNEDEPSVIIEPPPPDIDKNVFFLQCGTNKQTIIFIVFPLGLHIYIPCDVFMTLWQPWISDTVSQDLPKVKKLFFKMRHSVLFFILLNVLRPLFCALTLG